MRWRWIVVAGLSVSVVACSNPDITSWIEQWSESQAKSSRDDVPPPPRVEGPRIAEVDIPTEPPFVGTQGQDEHGYPLRSPDKVALLNLLRLKRFAELERFLTFYQDEFEKDFHKEFWPADALQAFQVADPEFDPLLDAWIEQFPDSFAAWAARGNHRVGLGWYYRGGAFADETSDAQFATKRKHDQSAMRDFEKALELRPRLVAVRTQLLAIAGTDSAPAPDQRARLDEAVEACPLCFLPRSTYMTTSLAPRWGGSRAAMQAFASEVVPLFSQNAKLALLAGYPDWDRCRTLRERKRYEDALKSCDVALKAGADDLFLIERALVLQAQGKPAEALPWLDRVLEHSPQEGFALDRRLLARREAGDLLGSTRDLVLLRHLAPVNGYVTRQIEWTLAKLRYEGQELYKKEQYTEAAEYFTLGLQLAPDDHDLMVRQGWNQKMASAGSSTGPSQAYPDDFKALLRIDHGLATSGRFDEVIALWDEYITKHPTDPRPYVERGGAKWHRLDHEGAIADMQKACDLGMKKACQDVPRMNARRPRR